MQGRALRAIAESAARASWRQGAQINSCLLQNSAYRHPHKSAPLRGALQRAKDEAFALIEQFGRFDPRAIEAVKKSGDLERKIKDINEASKAFDPEAKFNAIASITRS